MPDKSIADRHRLDYINCGHGEYWIHEGFNVRVDGILEQLYPAYQYTIDEMWMGDDAAISVTAIYQQHKI
jgi:hypothetical protein